MEVGGGWQGPWALDLGSWSGKVLQNSLTSQEGVRFILVMALT